MERISLFPDGTLTVSGDGTSVHTHSNPNGHSLPCPAHTLSPLEYTSLPRHYSDPDASWGWDSGLDSFYFGYTLFQLSCHNPVLHTDLPLLLRFTSARRHDSVSFLAAFHEMEKHMPGLSIKNMCLDSAMDNLPTYRLLKDRNIRRGAGPMEKTTKQNVNAAVPLPNMDVSLKPDLSGTSGYIQISPVVRKLIRKYISSEPQQNALTTVS